MPAKDFYHDTVRHALEKDGWEITHDPYFMRIGRRKGYVDLGAEMVAAERGTEKIAVEIKSLQAGIGQKRTGPAFIPCRAKGVLSQVLRRSVFSGSRRFI